MLKHILSALSSTELKDWIQIILTSVGILIALLASTYFASRQQRKTLTQNLSIETYKEMWCAVRDVNTACTQFAAIANLELNFLQTKINSPPMVGESQPDFDFRKRSEISGYIDKRNQLLSDISGAFLALHQLWEQNEPILFKLTTTFKAYRDAHNEIHDKTILPTGPSSNLMLENFDDIKPKLEGVNEELTKDYLQLMVYGMDFGRLLQEELIASYYDYRPIPRAKDATQGKELTRYGTRDVEAIKKEKE